MKPIIVRPPGYHSSKYYSPRLEVNVLVFKMGRTLATIIGAKSPIEHP
jgi:hypothetical protein